VSLKGKTVFILSKKSGRIAGWKKSGDYWTYTGSPGFVHGPNLRGYLATRKLGLSGFQDVKKNDVWMLPNGTPKLLRQQETSYSGPLLWGCSDLSFGRHAARWLPKVRQGEAGATEMAFQ